MSHTIKRQAMLIEIDGQVLVVKLSAAGWKQVLAIAAREEGGVLNVALAPNQAVFDLLSSSGTPSVDPSNPQALAERVKKQDSETIWAYQQRMNQIRGRQAPNN